MSVKMRQHIERQIARRFISDALKAGYLISVFDCEEFALRRSKNLKAILDAMFSTDDDRLFLYTNEDSCDNEWFGWVWFIYGNDGWDVISDYTCNLEHIMDGANKLSEKWQ